MTKRNFRRKFFDGKSDSRLSKQNIKEIEARAVFAIWYTDENGDKITSYWSTKNKAEEERKSLQEHGYTVSEVFKR